MEKKGKATLVIACAALLVLIATGCARCTMVHTGEQEATEQALTEETKIADDAQTGLDSLVGTKWTSPDGSATLSIVNGAFAENSDGAQQITFWTSDNAVADEGGFSESIWISDTATSDQTPSLVRVDEAEDGGLVIACDAFELSNAYVIDAPEDVELSIAGNVGYLAELTGVEQAEIAACLHEFAAQRCPYATVATWDGEIYIDANSESTSSTFTLNDPNATIVTVTIDGRTGELEAM